MTKFLTAIALSGGVLGFALARGKDQMQRLEQILKMHRNSFWM
jgi:hypothetical protein